LHCIETKAVRIGMGLQMFRIRLVPRDMQRHIGRCPRQLLDHRAIVELVEDAARLAYARKAREPCSARANTPRGHGDEKFRDLVGDCVDVYVASCEMSAQRLVVALVCSEQPVVFGRNQFTGNM
jgi:hypothetical protein